MTHFHFTYETDEGYQSPFYWPDYRQAIRALDGVPGKLIGRPSPHCECGQDERDAEGAQAGGDQVEPG